MVDVLDAIEPGLNLGEYSALQLESPIVILPAEFLEFGANREDSLLALNWNCAAQMNRDEVAAVGNFPMRQVATPKRGGFRLTHHGRDCSAGTSPKAII